PHPPHPHSFPTRRSSDLTSPPAAKCAYTDPVSEIEYGGRLRLTLTVSVLCPTRASDIALTLKVTNISKDAIHYDKNQAQFFSLLDRKSTRLNSSHSQISY